MTPEIITLEHLDGHREKSLAAMCLRIQNHATCIIIIMLHIFKCKRTCAEETSELNHLTHCELYKNSKPLKVRRWLIV